MSTLTTFVFVTVLMLPGMGEPLVAKEPVESLEACMARVDQTLAIAKTQEGKQYRVLVGCELTGNKADPA